MEKHPRFEERGLCEGCKQDIIDWLLPPVYDI